MDGLTIGPGLASGGGLAGTGGKIVSPQGLAYPGGLTIGPVVTPSMATWSPTNKNANITLSADKLTATGGGTAGTTAIGAATVAITTNELVMFSVVATNVDNSNSFSVGVANALANYASGQYLGEDSNSFGFIADGRYVVGGSVIGTIAGYTTGDTIDIAIRFNDGTIFRRINSGNWNDSPTADPATNTGGFATSVAGDLFPAYTAHSSGGGNSEITLTTPGTPPTGFTKYGA